MARLYSIVINVLMVLNNYQYSLKLYIALTISMSSALSICALFFFTYAISKRSVFNYYVFSIV